MGKSATSKPRSPAKKAASGPAGKSQFKRNTQFILLAGAVITIIGGLVIAAKPDAIANTPVKVATTDAALSGSGGRLATAQSKFNFGSISMARGKVTHRYPIRNWGSEPIFVRKIYTSCMCTTAALVKNGKTSEAYGMPGHTPIPTINVPINPREEAFVEVVFDPAAHGPSGVGPIERVVTLENSAGQPLQLEFAALVSP